VALRAFFDESGTHWGGPMACDVFVLCGYLAPESLWDDKTPNSLLAKWNDVMNGKPFTRKKWNRIHRGQKLNLHLSTLLERVVLGARYTFHPITVYMVPYIQIQRD